MIEKAYSGNTMLEVGVIGAGLGGLSTAIDLARAGHHVEVRFLSSDLDGEC